MAHKHIGQEDWPCIARILRAGFSFKEIARTIGKENALDFLVRGMCFGSEGGCN